MPVARLALVRKLRTQPSQDRLPLSMTATVPIARSITGI